MNVVKGHRNRDVGDVDQDDGAGDAHTAASATPANHARREIGPWAGFSFNFLMTEEDRGKE